MRILAGIVVTIIILMTVGCTGQSDKKGCILPKDCQLKTGDIVFRKGCGVTSHAVVMAEGNGDYSHVGIVVDSAGTMMIVHAVPDEPDFEGDVDRVKMDTPEIFFSAVNALKGEVRRYKDPSVAHRVAAKAIEVYRRHTLFDHDYDESDTTKLFCTELVTFAFDRVGCPLKDVPRSNLNLLGMHLHCALPSDLLESKDFQTVRVF
jgi:hypothetical protein